MARSLTALILSVVACHADAAHDASEPTTTELPAGSTGDEGDSGGVTAEREPPPPGCSAPVVGRTPLRRLSAVQYRNTVDELFGGVIAASDAFPASVGGELYTNDPGANPVSQLGVEQMMEAAELVALAVVEHPAPLMGCTELDDACARDYVEQLAPRAWRRPLREEEHTALLGLYAGRGDPAAGVAAVVSALLQSPSFLYLVDEGMPRDDLPDDVHALGDHELATRLSYLLWDRPPDAELRAAADAGELSDTAAIAEQTRRMLGDHERAGPAIGRFYAEWLRLAPLRPHDKEPALDPAVAAAIDRELVDFVAGVVLGETPQLATLWTSSRTRVEPVLAEWLGAPAGSEGWLELDATTRGGLLARPAVAAVHADAATTSPTRRGQLVRTRLLCESLPPPPPDAAAMAPPLPADASSRERAESRMDTAACAGCHLQMDAIGLAFEHHDARGAWREQDDGRAIDAHGEIVGGAGVLAGGFDGLGELQAKLADSEQVQDCLVQQWIRHVLGQGPNEVDPCVLAELQQRFAAADGDLRELVVLTTTSDAFRLRRLEAP